VVKEVLHFSDCALLVVGMAEAHLIKNGANAFLALKLSFANEMTVLCEALGADVVKVRSFAVPVAAASTIRARITQRCSVVPARKRAWSDARSDSLMTNGEAGWFGMPRIVAANGGTA
jgi:hypothetical protein